MKRSRSRWFLVAALAVFLVTVLVACGLAATPTPAPTEELVFAVSQITPIPSPTPRIIDPKCLVPEFNADETQVKAQCGGGFLLILSTSSFSDKVLGVRQMGANWEDIPQNVEVEFFYFYYDAMIRARELQSEGYYVMEDSRWILKNSQYSE